MKFNIIIRDLKIFESYEDVEEMIKRVTHFTELGIRKPTHLGIDEAGFTVILDIVED